MGFFDFLKKKELKEIVELKSQLERYRPISDIEVETVKLKKELHDFIVEKDLETKKNRTNPS